MATSSSYKKRSEIKCPVFGEPQKLSKVVLPTYEDMIKYYLFVKYEFKPFNTSKEPSIRQISERGALVIEDILTKASIPTIRHKRVRKKFVYHTKYKSLLKSVKNKQINKHYQINFKAFRESETKPNKN